MAIPSQPTSTTISTKALQLLGKRSPTSAEITDATDYAIEMVKKDLKHEGLEWTFLREATYLPCTAYSPKLSMPSDFCKLIGARIFDGATRGTAQAGTSSTITLASSTSYSEAELQGKRIVTTGGTGPNQCRYIASYNSSTKVATVNEAWDTTPDNTTTYLLVDWVYKVTPKVVYSLLDIETDLTPGTPKFLFQMANDTSGYLDFERPVDKAYVVELLYYMDILQVDLSSTRYDTILRLLQWTFIKGIFAYLLQDDSRKVLAEQDYRAHLNKDAAELLYPNQELGWNPRIDY